MISWVRALATKSDNLSSIPETHMVEREDHLSCSLTSLCHDIHAHTHTHTPRKIFSSKFKNIKNMGGFHRSVLVSYCLKRHIYFMPMKKGQSFI